MGAELSSSWHSCVFQNRHTTWLLPAMPQLCPRNPGEYLGILGNHNNKKNLVNKRGNCDREHPGTWRKGDVPDKHPALIPCCRGQQSVCCHRALLTSVQRYSTRASSAADPCTSWSTHLVRNKILQDNEDHLQGDLYKAEPGLRA